MVCAADDGKLRLVSPLPGAVYFVDPDVPSTRRVPMLASGGTGLVWESESLDFHRSDDRTFAVAKEGEHRLLVRDPATGRRAETWIRVKSL